LTGADILAPNGGQIEHLVFTGCSANGGCSVSGGTIESKPLKVEAALGAKSPEDTVLLKPVTKPAFAEFTLTGGGCPWAGVIGVRGKATLTLPKGREELAEQELSLYVNAESLEELVWENIPPMTLEGKVKLKLTSGKVWSFH
jgi:hypothetical protein